MSGLSLIFLLHPQSKALFIVEVSLSCNLRHKSYHTRPWNTLHRRWPRIRPRMGFVESAKMPLMLSRKQSCCLQPRFVSHVSRQYADCPAPQEVIIAGLVSEDYSHYISIRPLSSIGALTHNRLSQASRYRPRPPFARYFLRHSSPSFYLAESYPTTSTHLQSL